VVGYGLVAELYQAVSELTEELVKLDRWWRFPRYLSLSLL